jgi:transketolase
VLPPDLPCVAVEAGSPDLWRKYAGRSGAVIGMTTFGESAPAGELFKHFGFTAGHIVQAVKSMLARVSSASLLA